MNLDHLNQCWQQQPLPLGFAPAPLAELLAGRSNSPVARMLRNAWVEAGANFLFGLPFIAALFYFNGGRLGWLTGMLGLLYASTWYYYYRKLALLHQLRDASTALRRHLELQLGRLRQLLRLSFRLSLFVTVLLGAGALYGAWYFVGPGLAAAGQARLWVWLGLTLLVGYAITHWLLRWHLQSAYGQHLDRLDAALRELAEEA